MSSSSSALMPAKKGSSAAGSGGGFKAKSFMTATVAYDEDVVFAEEEDDEDVKDVAPVNSKSKVQQILSRSSIIKNKVKEISPKIDVVVPHGFICRPFGSSHSSKRPGTGTNPSAAGGGTGGGAGADNNNTLDPLLDPIDNMNGSISARIHGFPGGVGMNPESSMKYFGREGRMNFIDQFQSINSKRNITVTKKGDVVSELPFVLSSNYVGEKLEDSCGNFAFGIGRQLPTGTEEQFSQGLSNGRDSVDNTSNPILSIKTRASVSVLSLFDEVDPLTQVKRVNRNIPNGSIINLKNIAERPDSPLKTGGIGGDGMTLPANSYAARASEIAPITAEERRRRKALGLTRVRTLEEIEAAQKEAKDIEDGISFPTLASSTSTSTSTSLSQSLPTIEGKDDSSSFLDQTVISSISSSRNASTRKRPEIHKKTGELLLVPKYVNINTSSSSPHSSSVSVSSQLTEETRRGKMERARDLARAYDSGDDDDLMTQLEAESTRLFTPLQESRYSGGQILSEECSLDSTYFKLKPAKVLDGVRMHGQDPQKNKSKVNSMTVIRGNGSSSSNKAISSSGGISSSRSMASLSKSTGASRKTGGSVSKSYSLSAAEETKALSPRSKFIDACLQKQLNPVNCLLIRKDYSKKLDISHYGIGDRYGELMSTVIADLPYLESMNLTNNNFTDASLDPLMMAISNMPQLIELNLSQNLIGLGAATALFNYLCKPSCSILKLIITNADIDDDECARIISALTTRIEAETQNRVNSRMSTPSENKRINSTIQSNLSLNDKQPVVPKLKTSVVLPGLQYLDLSLNKIGISECLNTVFPDLVTGGEALAELLRNKMCPIKHLNLSWNMIRLDSAIELCRAVGLNRSLTYLNLSYNALSTSGGLLLGESLHTISCLQTLVICNNNINGRCLTGIVAGIVENDGLSEVNLDGNPIGQDGGKLIMLMSMFVGNRVKISANRCNLGVKESEAEAKEGIKFSPDDILGDFVLHMESPLERSIAILLLHLVCSNATYKFDKFEYDPAENMNYYIRKAGETDDDVSVSSAGSADKNPSFAEIGGGAGRRKIELVTKMTKDKMKYFTDKHHKVLKSLEWLVECASDQEKALSLFADLDEDGSGELDAVEFARLLYKLGIKLTLKKVQEIVEEYDIDGGGTIGTDEFLLFLKSQVEQSKTKIKDLTEEPHFYLKDSTKRFVPPKMGTLYISVIDGYVVKEMYRVVSSFDRENLEMIARQTNEASGMMTSGVQPFKLRLDEAYDLAMSMIKDSTGRIKTLLSLIVNVGNVFEVRKLLRKTIVNPQNRNSRKEINELRMKLGPLYKVLVGLVNGFYILDLSNRYDRTCLIKLLEINSTNFEYMHKKTEAWFAGNAYSYGHGHYGNYHHHNVDPKHPDSGNSREEAGTSHAASASELAIRKGYVFGDPSQMQNFSCFRNEVVNGVRLPTKLSAHWSGVEIPRTGIVEFDFAISSFSYMYYLKKFMGSDRDNSDDLLATTGGAMTEILNCNNIMTDVRLTRILARNHFIRHDEADHIIAQLKEVEVTITKSYYPFFHGRDHPDYKDRPYQGNIANNVESHLRVWDKLQSKNPANYRCDLQRSIDIGLTKHDFCSSLTTRGKNAAAMMRCEEFLIQPGALVATSPNRFGDQFVPKTPSFLDEEFGKHYYYDEGKRRNVEKTKKIDLSRDKKISLSHKKVKIVQSDADIVREFFDQIKQAAIQAAYSNGNLNFKSVFSKFDSSGNGELSASEFGEAMLQLGIDVAQDTMTSIYRHFDPNGNGSVSYGEFMWSFFNRKDFIEKFLDPVNTPAKFTYEKKKSVFSSFDRSGNGKLETKELTKYLKTVGFEGSNVEAELLVHRFDTDKDGCLSINEFIKFLDQEIDEIKQNPDLFAELTDPKKILEEREKKKRAAIVALPPENNNNNPTASGGSVVTPMGGGTPASTRPNTAASGATRPHTAASGATRPNTAASGGGDEGGLDGDGTDGTQTVYANEDGDEVEEVDSEIRTPNEEYEFRHKLLMSVNTNLANRVQLTTGDYKIKTTKENLKYVKARRILERLCEEFQYSFMYCRHLEFICQIIYDFCYMNSSSHFGTYRVDLIVALYHTILDPWNVSTILARSLTAFEMGCLQCRLGTVMLFNPIKPEGYHEFDVGYGEDRMLVKLMITLCMRENNNTWDYLLWRWQRDMDPMPGYEVTAAWLEDSGVPSRGVFGASYIMHGRPDWALRKSLLTLGPFDEIEFVQYYKAIPDMNVTLKLPGRNYVLDHADHWMQYFYPHSLQTHQKTEKDEMEE